MEELGARHNLLSCLNTTLGIEGLLLQQGKEAPNAPVVSGLLKLSLQPLWSAYGLFCKRKLELRRKALKFCNQEIRLVQRLIAAGPYSHDLFDQEAVDTVLTQAEHQAKPVLDLLGFRFVPRKRGASRQRGKNPKRQRGGALVRGGQQLHQQQQQPQQAPAQGQSPYYQWGSGYGQEQQYTPQRRGQGGYRGRGKSPRGRGGKSPKSPRRPYGRGRGGNF